MQMKTCIALEKNYKKKKKIETGLTLIFFDVEREDRNMW